MRHFNDDEALLMLRRGALAVVAVAAADGMNVVLALRIAERGVHFFHVQAAVGKARVTGGAGAGGGLLVFLMTGQTTDAFVDANAGAVITRTGLHGVIRRMALIAERLLRIQRHGHFPVAMA